MDLLGNLIIALGRLARFGIDVLQLLIIIQAILSWVGASLPLNTFTRLLYAITETIYRPIRTAIPTCFGAIDFTPWVALAGLYLIDTKVVSAIIRMGYQLAR